MVTTSNSVDPEILSPSKRAIYYHALRVHLQVSQWKHLDLRYLDPIECEWRFVSGGIEPVKTDLDAAPEWLIKVVRCNCKMTSRNPCNTQSCSCRKNGLKCVEACGSCHGEGCANANCEIPS